MHTVHVVGDKIEETLLSRFILRNVATSSKVDLMIYYFPGVTRSHNLDDHCCSAWALLQI